MGPRVIPHGKTYEAVLTATGYMGMEKAIVSLLMKDKAGKVVVKDTKEYSLNVSRTSVSLEV
jgi:hypothetical protein